MKCKSTKAILSLLVLLSALGLTACDDRVSVEPNRLIQDPHASGENQTGLYGELLALPFRVVVEGPVEPGLFGGSGSRRIVSHVPVLFEISSDSPGAIIEESQDVTYLAHSDVGGVARAHLRIGNSPGDTIIIASLPDNPEVNPIRFRALAGIERIGRELETTTNGIIEDFGIRLWNADGTPAAGVEVFFRIEGSGNGARLANDLVLSDENGFALNSWQLGDTIRRYFVSLDILDNRQDISESDRIHAQALVFEAMATSKLKMAVVLLGGLAIFIYGMKAMSEGLQRMADRRLKSILNFMTRNRFMAVAAGATIAGMVQSSTATTVMTVGFVNAGLMTLQQSIGVIFGANIGTTMTAQIIAFKLDELAFPSIAIGLLIMSVSRQQHYKYMGQAILGFGLLFLGMVTMSDILKPLRHSPEFIAWFKMVDCTPVDSMFLPAGRVLICILIGTIMTVMIQSSTATVGLVLALSSQGLIGFYTAVPLILGDNIGTTITANLAAIGANRNARRTAIAHTLFNVFGALYMYILFFIPIWNGQPVFLGFIDWITPGEVFSDNPENLLRHVANAHTAFNVFNVILFLPFVNQVARVSQLIVPLTDADKDSVLQYLEPNLFRTPWIALEQASRELLYMVRQGEKSVIASCSLLCEDQKDLVVKVVEREELIDRLQFELTEYLVGLSQTNLEQDASSLIPMLIHAVNDAERLGDHAEEMIELRKLLNEGKLHITNAGVEEINSLLLTLDKLFQVIYDILEKKNLHRLDDAFVFENEIDEQIGVYTEAHISRLDAGECNVQAGVIYLDALAHIERMGDHLLNIAERSHKVIQVLGS